MKQKYCKRAQAKQTHFFPSTGAKYTGTVDSLGFNVYLHGEIEYESSKEIKKDSWRQRTVLRFGIIGLKHKNKRIQIKTLKHGIVQDDNK